MLVEIKEFDDDGIGDNEFQVLLTEFKSGLGDYLKTQPGTASGAELWPI